MNVLSLNIRGLGVPGKVVWVREMRRQQEVSFVMLQETQHSSLDSIDLGNFWGRGEFLYDWVEANGRSGSVLSMWDPSVFSVLEIKK